MLGSLQRGCVKKGGAAVRSQYHRRAGEGRSGPCGRSRSRARTLSATANASTRDRMTCGGSSSSDGCAATRAAASDGLTSKMHPRLPIWASTMPGGSSSTAGVRAAAAAAAFDEGRPSSDASETSRASMVWRGSWVSSAGALTAAACARCGGIWWFC
jgi:hypothetical protein